MGDGARADRKAEKNARKEAKRLEKGQKHLDKVMQAFHDYNAKTAATIRGDLHPGEQVLWAQSVTRAGININRSHAIVTAVSGVANRVREHDHIERARTLGFPDARLMVLVVTDQRLLVYARSKLSSVEEQWGKPAQMVGFLALDVFAGVQWQQPQGHIGPGGSGTAGVIAFVFTNGAQHHVTTWNGANGFGETFNRAVATVHGAPPHG